MRQEKPNFDLALEKDFLKEIKIAIVGANWNSNFNDEMKESAKKVLLEAGLLEENISEYTVPGAFEMPVFAMHLTEAQDLHAIICFATIIKGDTYHFELVANESARGIMDIMLDTGVPILNGILACNNEAEAQDRASVEAEDKGREVALSALAMVAEICSIVDDA